MTLIIDVTCRGVDETRRLQLEEGEELVVGRDNRDVVLRKDQTLSRQHFSVRYSNSSIIVKHLSKTNPTLMAPDGSSEFERITETQTEFRTCRIIAGSHRFVATLESLESATISGDISEIWSDLAEKDDEVVENVKLPMVENVKLPIEDPGIDPAEQSEKPVFTWDDSIDEYLDSPTIVDHQRKPKDSASNKDSSPKRPTSTSHEPPLEDDALAPPPSAPTPPAPAVPEQAAPEPAPKPRHKPVERSKDPKQPDSFPDDFFD